MHLQRSWATILAGSTLLWALPAWAQDPGGIAPVDVEPRAADQAAPAIVPDRFLQLQAGLGLNPAPNSPVPFYYTELGASVEQTFWAPLGVRLGAEMDPGAFNEWMSTAGGTKTSFSGYSGDVDVMLSAAGRGETGTRPYIALGNRVTRLEPAAAASPSAAVTNYSMNLILGVKFGTGLVLETRYPLFSTNNGGLNPMPAYFETQIGYWRGF